MVEIFLNGKSLPEPPPTIINGPSLSEYLQIRAGTPSYWAGTLRADFPAHSPGGSRLGPTTQTTTLIRGNPRNGLVSRRADFPAQSLV